MTADWVKLPYELLEKLASRIINEVKGVNRCVFDITSKRRGRSSGVKRCRFFAGFSLWRTAKLDTRSD